MEILIQFLAMLLPAALKRLVLQSLLGWSIGPGVKIGYSIFSGCDLVRIGRNTQIGHFNMFRNLKRLEIGDDALIINFNDFMAGKDHWPASLEIGDHSQVTSHHFFDCSGGIRIGNFSLIAAGTASCGRIFTTGNPWLTSRSRLVTGVTSARAAP